MEADQFAAEVQRLQGQWPLLDVHFGSGQQSLRRPARALSQWHLALALAAGAISGVVKSQTGKVLVVKGDTHKEKTQIKEYTERDDGSIAETRILTDKFVPVIRAWDMTSLSPSEKLSDAVSRAASPLLAPDAPRRVSERVIPTRWSAVHRWPVHVWNGADRSSSALTATNIPWLMRFRLCS